ncbi:hypothetical protein JMA_24260 [Jeotgalibacillus malaysiensis]|uniref:Sporulation integral membrane protein YtvI n=1 Tax=Jeotgalibacillus malaysiensis TaxID=1508404 RepID=A0A0B5AT30_9BACL|nr:AI-2E family transporter [Jeotgalibacillus malaysiensis]AJD91743.1 hypothetical protein JMA_24260 [Jeotgalibacillus malaysiensis]
MIKRSIHILIILLLVLITVRTILVYFLPFTAGALVAVLLYPLVNLLFHQVKIPYKLSVLLGMILLLITGPLILTGCYVLLKNEILYLLNRLPDYTSWILHFTQNTVQTFPSFLHDLTHPYLTHSHLSMLLKEIEQLLLHTGKELISEISKTAGNLPSVLFSMGMMLIAAYYILADFQSWKHKLPPEFIKQLDQIRSLGFREAGAYFLSQLLLALLTFMITLTGLLLLCMPHPFFFALLSAALDFVPLASSLLLFLPLTIYYWMQAGPAHAAGTAFIYILIVGVRQITEPKIVGDRMGLHPLAALIVLYASVSLLGLKGLLLTPLFMIMTAVMIKIRLLNVIWRYISTGDSPFNRL